MGDVGSCRWRRLPVGAELAPNGGGVDFRLWAPAASRVSVVLEGGAGAPGEAKLDRESAGYFSGVVSQAADGTRYRIRIDERAPAYADPASRFQPDGPHGPSQVVDPSRFRWTDASWPGVRLPGQVIYEMHVGTFTPAGTWNAAIEQLPALREAGVTLLEVMPVADFPGRFGWGYDGVALFAPTRLYGEPDDFRRFVDRAHGLGLGVILDVVYNHVGPDGSVLKHFARDYFTDRYPNEWGQAINFDGPSSGPVREFFVSNAGYWIDEFHLDGLRLDATQSVHDSSPEHVIAALVQRARQAAGARPIVVVAENEPQDVRALRPAAAGGWNIDALCNDDFHHAARVALTGRREAYFTDYQGTPQELISAVKHGYLYQGQFYRWQGRRRGTPTRGVAPAAFVTYLENHDQIANSARGERLHRLTSPACYRAMAALLCLGPGTPLLFQGQEFGTSTPFRYFADHDGELAALVRKGRAEFLAQFPSLAAMQDRLPDPVDPATLTACKLDGAERARHGEASAFHRDLLRLRREDPVFRAQGRHGIDGAVLGPQALVLRFFGERGDDRLLLLNLGADLRLDPAPEPLLAPPHGRSWRLLWSSADARYGGCGIPTVEGPEGWYLPGHATVVLGAEASEEHHA
jgi:maltooligosyltrehalose trehalohydrolase